MTAVPTCEPWSAKGRWPRAGMVNELRGDVAPLTLVAELARFAIALAVVAPSVRHQEAGSSETAGYGSILILPARHSLSEYGIRGGP